MSFFSKLIKGIVIGAAVFITGGAALTLYGGSFLIAGSVATYGTLAAWGAVYGGLTAAAFSMVKKPSMDLGDVRDRANLTVDPLALGKWVFGETALATDIVYTEKVGDSKIVYVVSAAQHEIDSYLNFYINDELISFSGINATGAWAGALTIRRNLGTTAQSALAISGAAWPSDANGANIAHYSLEWDFSSANGKIKLKAGIPTRITQVGRGCKVYDPRLDSTNGGAGSHRANDPSTWAWSANWALIVIHYLMGYYANGKLVYGMGKSATEIHWPQVILIANVCDVVLDGKPRYRIGGITQITQQHEEVINQLESAIGGKVSKVGGKYYIWAPHDDLTPALTLTDADLLQSSGVSYIPSGPLENLYNTSRGQFVDPSTLYQPGPYPLVQESAAISEDGKARLLEHNFSVVQDVEIAQRVARQLVRRTRFTATVTCACGPKALLLKPFDVINLNVKETNNVNELFRVVQMQYGTTGVVALQLLEEDASIYDTTAVLGTSLTQLDPSTYDITAQYPVSGLAVTHTFAIGLGGIAINVIKLTWDAPAGFVKATECGYRINGQTDWQRFDASDISSAAIENITSDTFYEFRARHISLSDVAGAYSYITTTSGNATYDRVSAIGIPPPINPKLFITLSPDRASADIRASASYDAASSITPDSFFIFYSVADSPNTVTILTDTGTKLYIDLGKSVVGGFEVTVAAGSTVSALNYTSNVHTNIDHSGFWWAALRGGGDQVFRKVADATATTITFPEGDSLPFVPTTGAIFDVVEATYNDARRQEFRLLWSDNNEIIRHDGIKSDGPGSYYLNVVNRGAEATTQVSQAGKTLSYFPAPGPLTEGLLLPVASFTLEPATGDYFFSGKVSVALPLTFEWAALSCALAKMVIVDGKETYIRSKIMPLTIGGPV